MSRDIQTKQQNQKEVKRNPTKNLSKTPVDGEKEITYSSDRWKIEFKLQKYANSSFLPFLFSRRKEPTPRKVKVIPARMKPERETEMVDYQP